MSTLSAYAGLGPFATPLKVQNLMRRIGRVFGPSRILRTTDHLGAEGAFEDGARISGSVSHVELYKPSTIQEWAVNFLIERYPNVAEADRRIQLRAAAGVSAILGIDGKSPVTELIVWLHPKTWTPQNWVADVAQESSVPVHNLGDPGVFDMWSKWALEHTLNTTHDPSEDSSSGSD